MLSGDATDNVLSGNAGADTLVGGDGNDTLDGGTESDSLVGGAGIDIASYAGATSAIAVNLAAGTGSGSAAGDTYSSIEGIYGTNFGDRVIGDSAANVLYGGDGDDTISVLHHNDTIYGGTLHVVSRRDPQVLTLWPTLRATSDAMDDMGERAMAHAETVIPDRDPRNARRIFLDGNVLCVSVPCIGDEFTECGSGQSIDAVRNASDNSVVGTKARLNWLPRAASDLTESRKSFPDAEWI